MHRLLRAARLMRSRFDEPICVLVCVIVSMAAVRALFFHSGLPAYQHDWSWPFYRERFCESFATSLSTWNPEGLGHPNPFANANPASLILAAFGCITPAALALRICVIALLVLAGSGASRLGRGSPLIFRCASIVVYIASPVVFNKFEAGQVTFWIAYAMLPWTVYFTLEAAEGNFRPFPSFCALGVMGLSCVQPQFFAFNVLVALLAAVYYPSVRAAGFVACTIVAEAVFGAPFLFSALALNQGFSLTVPAPRLTWEQMQSASPDLALRMLGYIAPYADRVYSSGLAASIGKMFLLAFPLLLLGGLVRSERRRRAAFFLTLGVFGFLLTSGFKGPAGGLWAIAFDRTQIATVFREFYHGSALLAVSYAGAVASIQKSMPWRTVLAAIAILGLAPLLYDGHSRLQFVSAEASVQAARSAIASGHDGRFLPLPYRVPMIPPNGSRSGLDVLSWVDAEHESVAEYALTPEVDAILSASADGRRSEARRLMQDMGITAVWYRRDFAADLNSLLDTPLDPQFSGRERRVFGSDAAAYQTITGQACSTESCVAAFAPQTVSRVATVGGAIRFRDVGERKIVLDEGRTPGIRPQGQFDNASPDEGWVFGDSWRWLSASWDDMIDFSAATLRPAAFKFNVRDAGELAYLSFAPMKLCSVRCVALRAAPAGNTTPVSAGSYVLSSSGNAAVSFPAKVVAVPTPLVISIMRTSGAPWRASAILNAEKNASDDSHRMLIVFATRFDPGWSLEAPFASRHVRVNGIYNGWLVGNLPRNMKVEAEYDSQRPFEWAVLIAAVGYGALIVLLAATYKRYRMAT